MSRPLFRRMLGGAFDDLPPTVKALHSREGRHRYRGEVEVGRGKHPLARLMAWATRLPPAGKSGIAVEIDADRRSERWTRHVAGHAMPSRLWTQDGLLCESLGLVRFGFRLAVEDRAIVWRIVRVHALGLPLPTRWFEGVIARESEDAGYYRFEVHASLPVAGLLAEYRGWLLVRDPPTAGGPIVVFDGICVLCNGWVRFLLRHDRGRYRFAAMQSTAGRALLSAHGLDPDEPASFLLVEGPNAWTDTDAIRRVLVGLGGVWRAAGLVSAVPRFLRDPLYRWLARNRYRWFGTTTCAFPVEEQRCRFIG